MHAESETCVGMGSGESASSRRMSPTAVALFWVAAALVYVWWLDRMYLSNPVRFALLIREDGFLEYATATCFLVAAAVSGWTALRTRGTSRRVWCAVIAIGLFGLGMEEISWGQRILGLETPEALKAVNRQGELTLHNVMSGDMINVAMVLMVSVWLLASAGLCARRSRRAWLEAKGWPMASLTTAGMFVMVSILLHWSIRPRIQEAIETLLAAAVLVWVAERMGRYTAARFGGLKWWGGQAKAVGVAGLGLAVAAGLAWGLEIKRPSWSGWILNVMATNHYVPEQHYEQAAEVYAYIFAHPKNLQPDTYVSYLYTLDHLGREAEKQKVAEVALPYYRQRVQEESSGEYLKMLALSLKLTGGDDESLRLYTRAVQRYAEDYQSARDDDARAQVLLSQSRMLYWFYGKYVTLELLDEAERLDMSPQTEHEIDYWRWSISQAY